MRLDLAPGKTATLKQALVFGQFQPRLEGHSPDAAFPGLVFAGRDKRAGNAPATPPKRNRHARDMERVAFDAPKRRCDERASLKGPESAPGGDLGGDRFAGLKQGRRRRT